MICLNNMFLEQCYPICGTIILRHKQDTYTCPCMIKHNGDLKQYDESEIEIDIHNLVKEKAKKLEGNKIYVKATECPIQFEFIIDADIEHYEKFNKIRICNTIGLFEGSFSISFSTLKEEVAYFYPLINTVDGSPHYFDLYVWKDNKKVSITNESGFVR